jgi:hypothetical protein
MELPQSKVGNQRGGLGVEGAIPAYREVTAHLLIVQASDGSGRFLSGASFRETSAPLGVSGSEAASDALGLAPGRRALLLMTISC